MDPPYPTLRNQVWTSLVVEAGAAIPVCSPSNNNIDISVDGPGVITTPSFPDGYESASCIWKFQAPVNSVFAITIEVLQLQKWEDHLVIRDGADQSAPLIGKYGPCAKGSLTLFSSTNAVFLQANFPDFSTSNDLRIAYKPLNSGDVSCLNDDNKLPNFCSADTKLEKPYGVISSPLFPNNYGENENCIWAITPPAGYRLQLTFHWFGVEAHRYSKRKGLCYDDYVQISEKTNGLPKQLPRLCGCKSLFTHVSSYEKMWVSFNSYLKANWPGFYATYRFISPEECPADDTNCSIAAMSGVSFNAQGKVCSVIAKTTSSSPVAKTAMVSPSQTSLISLPTSSLESSTKMSSQELILTTSSQVASSFKMEKTQSIATRSVRETHETKSQRSSPVAIESTVKTSDVSTNEKIIATQMAYYSSSSSSSHLISLTSATPKRTDTLVTMATTTPQEQTQAMLSSSTMTTPKSSIDKENSYGSPLTVMSLKNTKVETIVTSATEISSLSSEKEKVILQHTTSVAPRLSKTHASYSLVIGPEKRETVEVVAQFRRARNVSVTLSEIKTSTITREIPISSYSSSQVSKQNLGFTAEKTEDKEASTVTELKSHKVQPSLSTVFYNDLSSKQGQDNEQEKAILQHTTSVVPRLSKTHASYSLVIGPEKRETVEVVAQFRRARNVSVTLSEIKTSTITREIPISSSSSSQVSKQNLGVTAEKTEDKETSTITEGKSHKAQPSLSTVFYNDLSSKQGQENSTPTSDSKSAVLVSSASLKSTGSYQSRTSVVKSTRIGGTTSLALPVHVISKSEHVTTILTNPPILLSHVTSSSKQVSPSRKPERVMPSKASEKASEIVSSEAPTVPATTSATNELHGNDISVVNRTSTSPKGITVVCTHYAMDIAISRIQHPFLVINSLHLLKPECKILSANDTHALLRAPLEGCGTERKTSNDYMVYMNTVMGDTQSSTANPLITREGRMEFQFQCSYRRIHILSIVSFSPRKKVILTSDRGTGNFTFEMDMYEDPKYNVAINQYPVNVIPGQMMYFRVDVKSGDTKLLAFLEECWVTPTANPRDQTRYVIIERGCPRDSTLQYTYQKSSTQKFSFQSFKFRHVPSPRLYVHCDVVTCRSSDAGSVCDMGCKENTRRRRRESEPYIMDEDVFLSLGPVNFQDRTENTWTSIIYVKVLASTLGVLILLLLIAIVFVFVRRRKRQANDWMLITSKTDNQENQEKETSAKLLEQTTEL
ncbi:mucin-4-like isoform X2 [Acropora millepora]|uniref:mucin-4-like isoform X2 n=1 Tax=Acropora millepora TaxID=45264 RepID=UPI001CF5663D|nr:mucin-4-like isoform X2 [Acropora millepora]